MKECKTGNDKRITLKSLLCLMLIVFIVAAAGLGYANEPSYFYYAPIIRYEGLQSEVRLQNIEEIDVEITLGMFDKQGDQIDVISLALSPWEVRLLDAVSFAGDAESITAESDGRINADLRIKSGRKKHKSIPFIEDVKGTENQIQVLSAGKAKKVVPMEVERWDGRLISSDVTWAPIASELNAASAASGFPAMTATGFYFPLGKAEFSSICGQWLARDINNGGCYRAGTYHIGTDMMAPEGSPVYAITSGTVKYISDDGWGTDNRAVAIQHQLYDGRQFLAIYGHIRTTFRIGDSVTAGQQIGTIGPWDNGYHLHFGVSLALTRPEKWGILPNASWPDTKGFIDPMYWLASQYPSPVPDKYESSDALANAANLALNAFSQSRTFHAAGDTDWAKFTLTARKTVLIQTSGNSGDTEMNLYGPNSSTAYLEYNDDGGIGLFSLIKKTLEPGIYYVRLNEYGSNGTIPAYKLSLHEASPVWADSYEPDDSAVSAKTVGGGQTGQTYEQQRSIHVSGNADWAKFTLKQRTNVRIETGGANGDTEMWLYGPNSPTVQIAYDDDSGNGFFSLIDRTLEPGTYFIRLTEYHNDETIPDYTLSLSLSSLGFPDIGWDSFEDDNTAAAAKAIAVDRGAQTHSIHTPGDTDWVKFTLSQHKTVRIETTGYSGDTEIRLYGPNSATALLAYDDDSGYGYFSLIERIMEPGTYYVNVQECWGYFTIDSYVLSVDVLP